MAGTSGKDKTGVVVPGTEGVVMFAAEFVVPLSASSAQLTHSAPSRRCRLSSWPIVAPTFARHSPAEAKIGSERAEQRLGSAGELGARAEQLVRLEAHGFAVDAGRAHEERIDLPRSARRSAAGPVHGRRHGAAVDRGHVLLPRIDEVGAQREVLAHLLLDLEQQVVALVLGNEIRHAGEIAESVRGVVDDPGAVVRVREDEVRARLPRRGAHTRRSAVEVREVAAAGGPMVGGRERPFAREQRVARRVVVGEHHRAGFGRSKPPIMPALVESVPVGAERRLEVALEPVVVLARDEIQNARDGVGSVNGRRSVRQYLDALDRERRDHGGIRDVWLIPESGTR